MPRLRKKPSTIGSRCQGPTDANVLLGMIELIATTALTAGSALLFAYWFRYTCLLILSAKTVRDYAGQIANAHQLGFEQVQSQLASGDCEDLTGLEQALVRDYAVVASLLDRAENQQARLETQMLQLHYRVMRAWFGISHGLSPRIAREALNEMCQVVAYLANGVGEAAAAA
jgi:hypothetical protein